MLLFPINVTGVAPIGIAILYFLSSDVSFIQIDATGEFRLKISEPGILFRGKVAIFSKDNHQNKQEAVSTHVKQGETGLLDGLPKLFLNKRECDMGDIQIYPSSVNTEPP